MTFKVKTPGFEQDFEQWTEALAKANSLRPALKSWFKDIRILENGNPVWVYGRLRAHPEYLGPGTYNRLAALFVEEERAKAAQSSIETEPWQIRDHQFDWGSRTYLMGVLNVTPDSFSDGGEFNSIETALAQAQRLVEAEMDILDIGGQSTRPGAAQISVEAECDRTLPIIQAIRSSPHDFLRDIPISIDTTRAEVARQCIAAGADIINDISGGTYDSDIFQVAADTDAPLILMHLRGTPKTMQQLTDYEDLMREIVEFLAAQLDLAVAAGVNPKKLAVDPGIGFAKTIAQNLTILRELEKLKALSCPILVGTSRKSFIGKLLNQPDAKQRIWGTAATCDCAIAHGADILRVHDGPEMRDVCRMADALWRNS